MDSACVDRCVRAQYVVQACAIGGCVYVFFYIRAFCHQRLGRNADVAGAHEFRHPMRCFFPIERQMSLIFRGYKQDGWKNRLVRLQDMAYIKDSNVIHPTYLE